MSHDKGGEGNIFVNEKNEDTDSRYLGYVPRLRTVKVFQGPTFARDLNKAETADAGLKVSLKKRQAESCPPERVGSRPRCPRSPQ